MCNVLKDILLKANKSFSLKYTLVLRKMGCLFSVKYGTEATLHNEEVYIIRNDFKHYQYSHTNMSFPESLTH